MHDTILRGAFRATLDRLPPVFHGSPLTGRRRIPFSGGGGYSPLAEPLSQSINLLFISLKGFTLQIEGFF